MVSTSTRIDLYIATRLTIDAEEAIARAMSDIGDDAACVRLGRALADLRRAREDVRLAMPTLPVPALNPAVCPAGEAASA